MDSRASSQGPDVAVAAMPTRPLVSTFGWEINALIASSPNFHAVERVHFTSPNAKVDVVIPTVERDGTPLIITGWNRHPRWPRSLFHIDWLKKNGDQSESCSSPLPLAHSAIKTPPSETYTTGPISRSPWMTLSKNCAKRPHMLAQMVSHSVSRPRAQSKRRSALPERERLYGKDGDCPAAWTDWLATGAIPDELLFHGSNDFLKYLPDEVGYRPLFPFSPPHQRRPRSRLSCATWA